MRRKYLAFDIETAKDVPDIDFNWRPHRPLGISCAAVLSVDHKEPVVWHGRKPTGEPAERMSRSEAQQLVRELEAFVKSGYTLLSWNGLGFDFDVLAEESSCRHECQQLALNHVDMMFHVFCDRGFPVALEKAAQGMAIPGKPPGMSGLLAPRLWAAGRFQEVLAYVGQDVRVALQVAQKCDEKRRFEWLTRKGTKSSIALPTGWLIVRDALRLPKPDTSWMDNPIPRSQFTNWIGQPSS